MRPWPRFRPRGASGRRPEPLWPFTPPPAGPASIPRTGGDPRRGWRGPWLHPTPTDAPPTTIVAPANRGRGRSGGPRSGRRRPCRLLLVRPQHPEHEALVGSDVDLDPVAAGEPAPQDLLRERVLDPAGDHPAERPGAELAVEPLLGQAIPGPVGDRDGHVLLHQVLLEPADLQVDDLADLGGRERPEGHDGVDPVEELRPEQPLQLLVDLALHDPMP